MYARLADRRAGAGPGGLPAGAGGRAAASASPAAASHYEQLIERRYLERLNEAYARFFHEYDAAPVLIVNAADIDPVGSEADYAELLAEIVRVRKGRHYFNPLKSLL